jgi:hypothetical protein
MIAFDFGDLCFVDVASALLRKKGRPREPLMLITVTQGA